MSILIRAVDGCVIGSRLNCFTYPPFWLRLGKATTETFGDCAQHRRRRTKTEILTPWGRIIGALVKHERGGIYLEVIEHKDRDYFFGKDIFCREHKDWHFARWS